MDLLLKKFFEKNRWESAIQTGVDKDIDKSLLRHLSTPDARLQLYRDIRDNKYKISPPHEAQIPKDDGTFRTVYVNDGIDRIMLSIINDMFFELCPELIHERCTSYQKGIGCGKIVQNASKIIHKMKGPIIGVKIDLSKYFDSVPIQYIDEIFDYIENKLGKSKLMSIVRQYYHDDTIIDIHKQTIHKYSSLRQGCAVAAFLADAVLHDIDDTISKLDVYYVRYSDDILIVGNEWEKAYNLLQTLLAKKELILNPKKIEILNKNKWFKFLGFNIKDDMISLSKSRTKTFQTEIEKRTIDNKSNNIVQIINAVNNYLYKGFDNHSWATNVLPIINVKKDIQTLNAFVMDAIRASVTNKTKIGGLGVTTNNPDFTIMRGTGKNVTSNRKKIPILNNYMTLSCMQNAILTSRAAYDALVLGL